VNSWNFPWNSIEYSNEYSIENSKENAMNSMEFHEKIPSNVYEKFHGIPWKIPRNSMGFGGIPWNFSWRSMEFQFHGIP
jgi:hypothetical protein